MPTRAGYAYEPKLDGFRCVLRTEGDFQARSRRFWNMTPLIPELEAFPARGVFDGELIAFSDGEPDFVALTDRMLLTRNRSIPVAFVAFDVLSLDGENVVHQPYSPRRANCSRVSTSPDHTGALHHRSTTATPSGRQCSGTNSRAWSPSRCGAPTNRATDVRG
jgi:ATP-dependent DNA ligase